MMLLDVNILIGAFRPESPDHPAVKAWLEKVMTDRQAFGVADGILCGFVRIVTRKPFDPVTPVDNALDFANAIRGAASYRVVPPNANQWNLFETVCRRTASSGKAAQDIYWASFALDLDCEFITFDGGFSRVPGLRWRSPLEAQARTNPR
jgi:toxin-antitoxin system PIN domain toxin